MIEYVEEVRFKPELPTLGEVELLNHREIVNLRGWAAQRIPLRDRVGIGNVGGIAEVLIRLCLRQPILDLVEAGAARVDVVD